jgi:hypothetical protein
MHSEKMILQPTDYVDSTLTSEEAYSWPFDVTLIPELRKFHHVEQHYRWCLQSSYQKNSPATYLTSSLPIQAFLVTEKTNFNNSGANSPLHMILSQSCSSLNLTTYFLKILKVLMLNFLYVIFVVPQKRIFAGYSVPI